MPVAFKVPEFYPILDTHLLAARDCSVLIAAEGLIEGGARIVQYRHKHAWTQKHFDEAKKIADLCEQTGVLFVLNDRADFARLLRSALHVGQEDLPPTAARRLIGDEVMGFSTHNKLQLTRANDEPVEYLSLGPIYPTTSKLRPDPTIGIDDLGKLRALSTKPVVAIGGITLSNAMEVFKAGADSVAIISGIIPEQVDRASIRERAEQWRRLVGQVNSIRKSEGATG